MSTCLPRRAICKMCAARTYEDTDEEDKHLLLALVRGVDIMEVFSLARVTRVCARYRLTLGCALDLRTGTNLATPEGRREALRALKRDDPNLVILSPPCTKFSQLTNLNLFVQGEEWARRFEIDRAAAIEHVKFCLLIMKAQEKRGNYYLFEHPALATSWEIPEMKSFIERPGVFWTRADLCEYG